MTHKIISTHTKASKLENEKIRLAFIASQRQETQVTQMMILTCSLMAFVGLAIAIYLILTGKNPMPSIETQDIDQNPFRSSENGNIEPSTEIEPASATMLGVAITALGIPTLFGRVTNAIRQLDRQLSIPGAAAHKISSAAGQFQDYTFLTGIDESGWIPKTGDGGFSMLAIARGEFELTLSDPKILRFPNGQGVSLPQYLASEDYRQVFLSEPVIKQIVRQGREHADVLVAHVNPDTPIGLCIHACWGSIIGRLIERGEPFDIETIAEEYADFGCAVRPPVKDIIPGHFHQSLIIGDLLRQNQVRHDPAIQYVTPSKPIIRVGRVANRTHHLESPYAQPVPELKASSEVTVGTMLSFSRRYALCGPIFIEGATNGPRLHMAVVPRPKWAKNIGPHLDPYVSVVKEREVVYHSGQKLTLVETILVPIPGTITYKTCKTQHERAYYHFTFSLQIPSQFHDQTKMRQLSFIRFVSVPPENRNNPILEICDKSRPNSKAVQISKTREQIFGQAKTIELAVLSDS